ncbi:MAG: hypothetical protein WC618_01820 [Patescibacteria group bacterium]
MNQKSLIAILGVVIVVSIGTTVYFATINRASQPIAPNPKVAQQPAQPIPSQPVCGKLPQFRNESWANNLNALYKSDFLKELEGDLWYEPGTPTMAGELSSCKIKDLFVFIPEYFEFGCGRILKYDIKNNKLTVPSPGDFCASRFGQVTDTYIEYFGNSGDGGQGTNYHGRYYFNEDRIEKIK